MGGELDQRALHWINDWPDWLEPVMLFFTNGTNYLIVKIGLALLVLGMILRGGKARLGAVHALLAFPLANEITDAFKRNLPVERPFQALEWVLVRGGLESESMGTASAHSANMAAVAFAFTAALGWRWGLPWILAALLTGLSRIYVGVHFPSQVILGWACGVFAGMVIVYTYRAWQRRRDLREAQPA